MRSPLIIRTTVLAELVGACPKTVARWSRDAGLPLLRVSLPGKPPEGPLYLSTTDAAKLALLMVGSRADAALAVAIKRRGLAQTRGMGPRAALARPTEGTGVPE